MLGSLHGGLVHAPRHAQGGKSKSEALEALCCWAGLGDVPIFEPTAGSTP